MTAHLMTEWDEITITKSVSDPNVEITNENAESLLSAIENFTGKKEPGAVLEKVGGKLKSYGTVGLIQTEDCSLEILPKIDVKCTSEENRNFQIRNRLVHMISIAEGLNIDYDYSSSLGSQDKTLLEILIWLFARRLADAVRHGLSHKYIEHQDDLSVLRGSLNTVRQFTINAANPARLACRFDEFSQNIALNQAMKSAVEFLSKKTTSLDNQMLLKDISLIFSDIESVPVDRIEWDLITIDRTNEKWRDLLSFARLLLNSEFQNTSSGLIDGYSLLFSMNVLFQEYIGRLIEMSISGSNRFVKLQEPNAVRLRKSQEKFEKTVEFGTKADFVIRSNDAVEQIIDAKWKHILNSESKNWDVDNSDIYQMVAYSKIYGAKPVSLVYPHNSHLDKEGFQLFGNIGNENEVQLRIFTFDLSDDVVGGLSELDRIERLVCLPN